MPELPDVEVYKRYIDATSPHKKITRVEVTDGKVLDGVSARSLREALEGRSVESTRRHGKYLFVELDNKYWLVLHFGMTGDVRYYGEEDDTPKYARVVFTFDNGYRLAYISRRMLGKVALTDDPDGYICDRGLGPDAMSLGLEGFRDTLGTRGTVKSRLMDQGRIAGIGNVYSDEILFQAGIHPKKDVGSLAKSEIRELYKRMRHVLNTAVKKKADPDEMPESWLLPVRGKEAACPLCGGMLKGMKVSGRKSWYCPSHQKR